MARVLPTAIGGSKRPEDFMHDVDVGSTARMGYLPILPLLAPFPLTCFVGALITDLVYWRAADVKWETFSVWLITAGLIVGALAGLAGIIDFLTNRRVPALTPAWPQAVGILFALLLALVNAFVHSRDGYTAVVPQGLILSALVVVILAFTGWIGWTKLRRNVVRVAP
jgi:uncharacterized membrane protein